jgi:hypothetical protein
MRGSQGAVISVVLALAGACSVPAPAERVAPSESVASASSAASASSPSISPGADPTATAEPVASTIAEPGDPTLLLTGRGVEALGGGGTDVVMRIGAAGFRLPEGEQLYDLHGDRVLSVIADPDGANARMVVRDLNGAIIREFDTGMQVPQTGIVRGEDVYFGGIDFAVLDDPMTAMDRGAWVVHGDAPAEPLIAPAEGLAIYHAFERSPDGQTIGISFGTQGRNSTVLIRSGSDRVEIPRAGLIAMTNDVALLIGMFSDVTAFAIADGAELWRAETEGLYYGRYATTDGTRIVISSIENPDKDGDGISEDQLRIEVLDGLRGTVQRDVPLPGDAYRTVMPTLSSDRYAALFDGVIPDAAEGSRVVQIVDLETGQLLDVELAFGDVP